MKKALLILASLGLMLSFLSAQTLSRQVIGATGSANEQLSSTTGETVVTTAVSGSFILTQGFHQPENATVGIRKPVEVVVNYNLYPNPALEQITLELSSARPLDLRLQVIDMRGRMALPAMPLRVDGSAQKQLDVSTLATGAYALQIMTAGNEPVKTLTFEKRD